MKIRSPWWLVVLCFLTIPAVASAGKAPAVGDQLENLRLPTPESTDTRTYLGLPPGESFPVTAITGKILVIEIFSMYCPHCQREAPAVNRLYQAIQDSGTLRDRVRMIGIGVGNSTFEINHFRKHYSIPFPLFPDEDFSVHKAIGEVRTPFFIIIALGPDGKGRILWTKSGSMGELETFMARLNDLARDGEP
ncbi:TlpA disulfide reductase family protein [uncultured Desulfosarcina sp.]|uniref:peroxiredoxin family protein n=1 Tax=uncultured Desulfosarcina sp. TaxID=218289 RepID=UPI0029C73658|nr:TlpA disulfide reductase family protein [uncultured Desulfosarcina sp.]